jgi:hypothetical protein
VKVGDCFGCCILFPPKPALRETGTLHLSVGNWYTLGGEGSGDVVIIVSGGMKEGGNQFKCRKSQNSFSVKRPHSFSNDDLTLIGKQFYELLVGMGSETLFNFFLEGLQIDRWGHGRRRGGCWPGGRDARK